MAWTKELELAFESLSLLLSGCESLGLDEFNRFNEFAPLASELIASRLGMRRAELRAYIHQNGAIEFTQLQRDLLHQKQHSLREKTMNKPNFDDIGQIPVVHVSVQSTGGETLIRYESNDEKLLNEVVSQIDKSVFDK